MKDYTFFTKTDKEKFILGYRYIKNKIIVYFADGSIIPYNFTIDNLEEIQKMMAEQIKIAYLKYKKEKDDFESILYFLPTCKMSILYFLKLTFFIISRGRNIEKYKLFSDILNELQVCGKNEKFLSYLPIKLDNKLVSICDYEGGSLNLSLNNADDFSLKEIKVLSKTIEELYPLATMEVHM